MAGDAGIAGGAGGAGGPGPTAVVERVRQGGFGHAVLSWVGEDGYPQTVATGFELHDDEIVLTAPAYATPSEGQLVNVTFSHIRPQPGIGYDERRYTVVWGEVRPDDGHLTLRPAREWHWDERERPFFQYSEETVPRARRYFEDLSRRAGAPVRPRLSRPWLALLATRLPFLSATIVPVLVGVAVAARQGTFRPGWGLLTLVGAVAIHLGLNVANDVFDARSGADEANTTPTPFSGGSRVIQYGLVSLRSMAWLCAGLYATGIAAGLWLAVARGFWPLMAVGAAGVFLSLAYTAPPLRLVHHGLGEVAVALGFGPVVTMGTAYVQTRSFTFEAFYASLPVAAFIALVLYVNEIPDRHGDAAVGKRTLPVRLDQGSVVWLFKTVASLGFVLVVLGVLGGTLPAPALLVLAAVPLARKVAEGIDRHYDAPYELMPVMAENIKLHVVTGLLLFAGYLVAIGADAWLDSPPFLLR